MSEHCSYWRWGQARRLGSPAYHYGSLAPRNLFSLKLGIFFYVHEAWEVVTGMERPCFYLRQFSLSCRRPHLTSYSRMWVFVFLWHGSPEGRPQTFLISRSIHTFVPYLVTPFKSIWMSFSLFLSFATSYTIAILISNAYCLCLFIPTWIYASINRTGSLSVLFTVVHRLSKTVSGTWVMGVLTVSIPWRETLVCWVDMPVTKALALQVWGPEFNSQKPRKRNYVL